METTVLYLCAGNVCRSPAAELLLRDRTGPRVSVRSAGLDALIGQPIDTATAQVLWQRGLDVTRHRARLFQPAMAAGADLILTAERGQRDLVMAKVPTAHRRTFTMREFARLASRADLLRPGSDAVLEVARIRGIDGVVPADADDIPDCYRADVTFTSAVVAQIASTVDALVRLLAVDPRRRPRPYRTPDGPGGPVAEHPLRSSS